VKPDSYKARHVDFADYTTCSFNPHLFSEAARAGAGCGPSTLALLTGEPPKLIAAENHWQPHTSARFMRNFLRARGYGVLEITRDNILSSRTKIYSFHVVLLAQLFRNGEGTWSVLHNGVLYHNCEGYTMDSLSLLNKPIVCAFLVVHPRWRRFDLEKNSKAGARHVR